MRNNPIPYIVITGILLLIDWYVFQAVKTATRGINPNAKRAIEIFYWVITVGTLASIYATAFTNVFEWPKAFRTYLFGAILLLVASKLFVIFFLLIEDFVRLFRWLYTKIAGTEEEVAAKGGITRSEFLNRMALLVAALPLSAGIYGIIKNAYDYRFHRVKIPIAGLPDVFDGFKMVQLSDIHSGSLTRSEPIEKVVERINKENADLVFFTGDLVNSDPEEINPFIPIFSNLKGKEGVIAVYGNHDYGSRITGDRKNTNLDRIADKHRQMGWQTLRNEHRMIERNGQKLAIIGVENWSAKEYFPKTGDLSKAAAGTENAAARVLLSHDPTHWDAQINTDFQNIDLTLSGHTHGAQLGIEIPGLRWSPSQYVYKQWAGLYQQGKQYLYVNRGFGFIGFPGRVGILPEVTVIELVKA